MIETCDHNLGPSCPYCRISSLEQRLKELQSLYDDRMRWYGELQQKLKEVEKERDGLYSVIKQQKELFQKHCDHEWKTHDDSFDHEFGTEKIVYDECEHCELRRPYEKHEDL